MTRNEYLDAIVDDVTDTIGFSRTSILHPLQDIEQNKLPTDE